MSLTVAIHQPQYLPWLGYFDKADSCDVFVHLDNVQFQRAGYQNRNQVKTQDGARWLTVPVRATRNDRIADVCVADQRWTHKHIATLERAYAHAPYVSWFRDGLRPLLSQHWNRLVDLNLATTAWLFERLGIVCRSQCASALAVGGAKDDLIIGICRAVGADVYLSGPGARAYQDPEKFRLAGIELRYQDYRAPEYQQQHAGLGFVPDLSALDVVLNLGSGARAAMLSGRRKGHTA